MKIVKKRTMKYLMISLSILLSTALLAQTDTVHVGKDGIYINDNDGTVVRIGKGGIQVFDHGDSINVRIGDPDLNKNVRTRWVLMDLGTDVLLSDDDYTLENGIDPFEINAWKSTNVNLHLFQQRINLINHAVNLKWGLTFHFHKYMFDNPVTLDADSPQATFTYHEGVNFKKNRLSATYLTMPVMFNFETKPRKKNRSFHINVGAYGGPRLGANFKTKLDGNKDKVKDDFNLAKWRYGLRTEIGFSGINLYATLALNELFQENKNNGYKVTPLSVGFVLIPF